MEKKEKVLVFEFHFRDKYKFLGEINSRLIDFDILNYFMMFYFLVWLLPLIQADK